MKNWIKMARLISDRENNCGIWIEDPLPIAIIVIEEHGLSDIMKILNPGRIIKVAESITKDEAIEYVMQHEKI